MRRTLPRRLLPFFAGLLLAAAPAFAGDDAQTAPADEIELVFQTAGDTKPKDKGPDRVLAPMLWRVTGNGLKAPSYLFGTIHLSDPRITGMHPLSRAAFKRAATLHTEIAMTPAQEQAMGQAVMRKDGKKLTDDIGPELFQRLDAEVKRINPMLSCAMFQPLKTWAVAVTLGSIEDQAKGGDPLDKQLWNKAKQAHKRCEALETMTEHTGGFDTLSAQEQRLLLKGALDSQQADREGKSTVNQALLVNLYLCGDVESLGKLDELAAQDKNPSPEEKALEKKVHQFLILDRNEVMAKAILKECKAHPEQSHFFAAGTAHFAGKGNVRELLEKEGYKIERLGMPKAESTDKTGR